ncbi:tetratricopeptide repeat protein [Shimia sp. FJ5]|uniref:tetratricopeptide repeat protein n=1 Tax=Shimia sp. FJ5 TaxID=3079054 RepID=UPI00260234AD|nr:tetratricopeptide repeat protein [Shimia sp. FJ5]MDV4145034.1 tetratricopeptide repeat protein [Shimia sp. FJ5]
MARFFLRSLTLSALLAAASLPAFAQGNSGAYLAARQASFESDYAAAAQYYTRAIARDPSNPKLLENAVLSYLSLGRLDTALPIARKMLSDEIPSQLANLVIAAGNAREGNFDNILNDLDQLRGIGPLVDGLLRAWANLGAGDMSAALAAFDKVAEEPGLAGFAAYHKALALASVGDYEGAEEIYSDKSNGAIQMTRRGVLTLVEILSQLGRNEDAVKLLSDMFGTGLDPDLENMRAALAAGEKLPFTHVRNTTDGIAEVFYSLASALRNEATPDYTLLYARAAQYLRPDHFESLLLTAELLETLGRFTLASEVYKQVPADHPSYHAAELGRAEALRLEGKTEAAIEVLEQLTRSHGDLSVVYSSLGDLLRQEMEFAEAAKAYDRALELSGPEDRTRWFLLYTRGICFERLGDWRTAEKDFRAALELRPEQPQVLNYLGYTLVEKEQNLDEALDMIERAVAARPDSGYIMDSLGWVLYRLGRYEEAVGHMERAAELEPIDPVVNDHLGDVYWAVGRFIEAEFQWKRALSFVDEDSAAEAKPDRIRRKLEVGLDTVLEEEGAAPLKVANED